MQTTKLQKLKMALLGIILSYGLVFAQGESSGNPAYDFFGVYNGSMKFLNFYVEYGTGDLSSLGKDPKANKRNGENFDTKLTYRQTLKKAPWLGFGFVLQTIFDKPSLYSEWKEGNREGKNTGDPFSSVSLSANAYFLNTFSIGLSSSGVFNFTMFLNKRLPQVSAFRSHAITFMIQQDIFIRGNQYTNNEEGQGILSQGWYDGTEFRVAYQMRINEWFAFRPELQFKIFAGAQTKFNDWYWIRFNPRFQFFVEEWTFFVEPRLFYGGFWKRDMSSQGIGYSQFNKDGWAIELKVGIDLTKLFFD